MKRDRDEEDGEEEEDGGELAADAAQHSFPFNAASSRSESGTSLMSNASQPSLVGEDTERVRAMTARIAELEKQLMIEERIVEVNGQTRTTNCIIKTDVESAFAFKTKKERRKGILPEF